MKSTGAGFVVFTTSHAMRDFPRPLASIDAILLARSAKAGDPQRMISFNAWEWNNPTPFDSYCTGEACYDPREIDGLIQPENQRIYPVSTPEGLLASACLIADSNRIHTAPKTPPTALCWNADQFTELLRGFIAHKNVPIFNLEITQDGKMSADSHATFAEAARRLK